MAEVYDKITTPEKSKLLEKLLARLDQRLEGLFGGYQAGRRDFVRNSMLATFAAFLPELQAEDRDRKRSDGQHRSAKAQSTRGGGAELESTKFNPYKEFIAAESAYLETTIKQAKQILGLEIARSANERAIVAHPIEVIRRLSKISNRELESNIGELELHELHLVIIDPSNNTTYLIRQDSDTITFDGLVTVPIQEYEVTQEIEQLKLVANGGEALTLNYLINNLRETDSLSKYKPLGDLLAGDYSKLVAIGIISLNSADEFIRLEINSRMERMLIEDLGQLTSDMPRPIINYQDNSQTVLVNGDYRNSNIAYLGKFAVSIKDDPDNVLKRLLSAKGISPDNLDIQVMTRTFTESVSTALKDTEDLPTIQLPKQWTEETTTKFLQDLTTYSPTLSQLEIQTKPAISFTSPGNPEKLSIDLNELSPEIAAKINVAIKIGEQEITISLAKLYKTFEQPKYELRKEANGFHLYRIAEMGQS